MRNFCILKKIDFFAVIIMTDEEKIHKLVSRITFPTSPNLLTYNLLTFDI